MPMKIIPIPRIAKARGIRAFGNCGWFRAPKIPVVTTPRIPRKAIRNPYICRSDFLI